MELDADCEGEGEGGGKTIGQLLFVLFCFFWVRTKKTTRHKKVNRHVPHVTGAPSILLSHVAVATENGCSLFQHRIS